MTNQNIILINSNYDINIIYYILFNTSFNRYIGDNNIKELPIEVFNLAGLKKL